MPGFDALKHLPRQLMRITNQSFNSATCEAHADNQNFVCLNPWSKNTIDNNLVDKAVLPSVEPFHSAVGTSVNWALSGSLLSQKHKWSPQEAWWVSLLWLRYLLCLLSTLQVFCHYICSCAHVKQKTSMKHFVLLTAA